jgi:signal transduction histidine kinase
MRPSSLSVKHKFVLAGMATAATALLLASAGFVAYDRVSYRRALAADLSALAEIAGANSTAALSFRDARAGEELLRSLGLKDGVRGAALFFADGAPFARFGRVEAAAGRAAEEEAAQVRFSPGRVSVREPVRLGGETLGTLVLEADLAALDRRLRRYMEMVGVFVLACSLVAFFVASALQRVIAGPIERLAQAARRVSEERNYAVRVPGESADEMGVLVRAFNQMLSGIEERDDRLREQNAALAREVEERRLAEAELKKLAERLARSNRELEDFAYVASHDLQEPLRKVQAFGDRLQARAADALGPEGLDYIARMRSAAHRMQTLIADLLTFSRVTTKARPFASVDLALVAREVAADLEVRIEETGAELDLRELPVIEADPLQMRQLLQNLIGNALKFQRPGVPPVVEVSSAFRPPDNGGPGHCVLRVADNGIGFDEKYLPRLFGIFQRLHSRTEYEGNGVGLAICRKIAERHGGRIAAQGRPGEGATFVVDLPVRQKEGKSS